MKFFLPFLSRSVLLTKWIYKRINNEKTTSHYLLRFQQDNEYIKLADIQRYFIVVLRCQKIQLNHIFLIQNFTLKAIRFVNSVCMIVSLRKQSTPHQSRKLARADISCQFKKKKGTCADTIEIKNDASLFSQKITLYSSFKRK